MYGLRAIVLSLSHDLSKTNQQKCMALNIFPVSPVVCEDP